MVGPRTPAFPDVRLSLVLPSYNEGAGIRRAVVEADDALATLVADYEVLVVDDGSRDGTAEAVRAEAAGRPRVRLLRHEANRGYGAALRTGFAAARFDRVAFTDADCQFHLADLARLLPLAETAPVAVGYRVGRQDPWRRRFLSGGYNRVVRVLLGTGVRDVDCALKIFHRDALAGLMPETDGFFVNAEMLAKARQQGLAVAEAGVRHRPRLRGQSTVSVRQVPRVLGRLLPFWWSRVLFPGRTRADAGAPAATGRPPLPALLLVLLVAGLLFFARLRAPLLEPQEPRYAEIPRQMLAEGSWLVPVLHGQPYLDKPPLLYWLVMACYGLFGVSDAAARLVPGCAGVLTVLLTYLWGRRAAGERAGLCAALVLALAPEFVYRGRMLTMDGLLCVCVTAALAAAHAAVSGPRLRRGWWLASAAACGLGLLAKGPVALVLVAGPVLALRFLDPRTARVGWRDGLVYLVAAAGPVAPWFAAVARAEPEFLADFFWRHHVVRFLEPFDHAGPAWYYLPGLLAGMLPWSLLLPGLAIFLARRPARAAARRPAALGFFLLAFATGFGFFSAAGCKRPGYLLPALPPLALALGCYLDASLARAPRRRTWEALWRRATQPAFRAAAVVLVVGAVVAAAGAWSSLLRPWEGATLACAALAGLAAAVRWRRRVSWAASAAAAFAVLFTGIYALLPAYNRHFAFRAGLHAHAEELAGESARVACYPQRWDSASFYLPHAAVRTYAAGERGLLMDDLRARPDTLLLVKSGRALDDLLHALPPSAEFVAKGRQGAFVVGKVRQRGGPGPEVVAERGGWE